MNGSLARSCRRERRLAVGSAECQTATFDYLNRESDAASWSAIASFVNQTALER